MSVKTNTISERTADAGVTIDGLQIKDGGLPSLPGAGITSDQAAALAAYQAALTAAETGQVLTAVVGEESREVEFAGLALPKRIILYIYHQGIPVLPPTIQIFQPPPGATVTATRHSAGTFFINCALIGTTTAVFTQRVGGPMPNHTIYAMVGAGKVTLVITDLSGNPVDGTMLLNHYVYIELPV